MTPAVGVQTDNDAASETANDAANEKGRANRAPFSQIRRCSFDQRLENWNERRALARPYFLRSTTRESRVRKPARLSVERSSGSK